MKHEQSNVKPLKYIVEFDGKIHARITITDPDSLTETPDDEGNPVFEYRQYQTTKPYRANLAEDVAEHFDEWFALVKREDEERTAAVNRAHRNALLRDSDAEMSLDRVGLEMPTGSSFSAWLSFLKKIAEMTRGRWATYRQALRDLPTSPNWPYISESDWPIPPSKTD